MPAAPTNSQLPTKKNKMEIERSTVLVIDLSGRIRHRRTPEPTAINPASMRPRRMIIHCAPGARGSSWSGLGHCLRLCRGRCRRRDRRRHGPRFGRPEQYGRPDGYRSGRPVARPMHHGPSCSVGAPLPDDRRLAPTARLSGRRRINGCAEVRCLGTLGTCQSRWRTSQERSRGPVSVAVPFVSTRRCLLSAT